MKTIWFFALIFTIPTSGLSLIIALIATFIIIGSSKEPSKHKHKNFPSVTVSKEPNKNESEEENIDDDIFVTIQDKVYYQYDLNKQTEIKNFIKENNIQYLVHFTRVENLQNILLHGLLSKASIREKNIKSLNNDQLRLDDIKEAICVSISFPNYKMFYKLQKEQPNAEWVILKLDPCIMYELKAAFCYTNAASKIMRRHSLDELCTLESLKIMFAKNLNNISRENLNIPKNFTTDPQAEIMFLETIDPKYIKEICLKNSYSYIITNIKSELSSKFQFTVEKNLFKPRSDYNFWKNKG